MTAPIRIQLRRTKGWRMPPNTVKVDRTSTDFGNPFPMLEKTLAEQQRVLDLFALWFVKSEMRVLRARYDLRGKNLACWCAPGTPCHADVLMALANKGR